MILTVTANPAVDTAYFVEGFNMGEVHRPVRAVTTAGGKGLNVAKVVTALGERASAMGFVGGYNGKFIKSEVDRLGIENLLTEINGETRRNIDIIDSEGNTGEILEAGPEINAEEERAFFNRYVGEIDRHDFICASGSLPRGIDADFYCKLVSVAKEKGKRILVDTSGKNLEAVIEAKPFMIKPNRDEMVKLFGYELDSDGSIKDALSELYKKGIELPFVTLGGDGGAIYDGDAFYRFRIPEIKVKNTVGSGDSTVAGVAVGLCRDMPLRDAVRLGMAAGMSNAESEQSGAVCREAVEGYYQKIRAVRI